MPIIFWAPHGVATAKIRNLVGVPPPLLVVSQALKEIPGEPYIHERVGSYFFILRIPNVPGVLFPRRFLPAEPNILNDVLGGNSRSKVLVAHNVSLWDIAQ